MSHDGSPGPDAPAPWNMTWPGAAPGHHPAPEEPRVPDAIPAPVPYEPAGDLLDDLGDPDDLAGPRRPRRVRGLPRPAGGPALTTLFVAALGVLLVTVSLVWPAPVP